MEENDKNKIIPFPSISERNNDADHVKQEAMEMIEKHETIKNKKRILQFRREVLNGLRIAVILGLIFLGAAYLISLQIFHQHNETVIAEMKEFSRAADIAVRGNNIDQALERYQALMITARNVWDVWPFRLSEDQTEEVRRWRELATGMIALLHNKGKGG